MGLTVKKVDKLLRRGEAGRYLDATGLYLIVANPTNAHWELRFQLNGRGRWMGLGSARTFSLEEARSRAKRERQLLADKVDPLMARRAARAAQAAAAAKSITFGKAAEDYFRAQAPAWKSPKHAAQWRATILGKTLYGPSKHGDYCGALRALPVAAIDTAVVIRTLEPLWHAKPETMSRVRARIENVLDWATVRGYRSGDNPAAWRTIGKALPSRAKIAKIEHFAALPYRELPTFMAKLREREGVAARALEFTILTAARTAETIGARWDEISGNEWVIPEHRMKGGRAHRVPLSLRAVELLASLYREDGNEFVFIGSQSGAGLSSAAAPLPWRCAMRAKKRSAGVLLNDVELCLGNGFRVGQ
jgi:integrase